MNQGPPVNPPDAVPFENQKFCVPWKAIQAKPQSLKKARAIQCPNLNAAVSTFAFRPPGLRGLPGVFPDITPLGRGRIC